MKKLYLTSLHYQIGESNISEQKIVVVTSEDRNVFLTVFPLKDDFDLRIAETKAIMHLQSIHAEPRNIVCHADRAIDFELTEEDIKIHFPDKHNIS